MITRICVFCASGEHIPEVYFKPAAGLGRLLAENKITLVYGGGKAGLMGALARAVHAGGGEIISVIPVLFRERKQIMEQEAQAFIALPGGTGTLDEILEILTARQLGFHQKPLVLINTRGFFNPLIRFFNRLYRQGFMPERVDRYLSLAKDERDAFKRILYG
jgi:predicted Rossmann-fold nucleotide-binding protein